MQATQQARYDRLVAFEFDEPAAELTFARRLARENGWSETYSERVILEYKRFVLLAAEAGHMVTPSEQVDQAWHLHLTYTRSYWDGMCRGVLGQPLHHGPTKGGAGEQAKFSDLYRQTLASYRRLFGHEPPPDIWSAAEQRFGADLQHVSVNTARNWIIPKPRWPSWRLKTLPSASPCILGLVVLPLAAATWNPLDWTGAEFLPFYFCLALIAALLASIVRVCCGPQVEVDDFAARTPLDPYEAACLTANPLRAVHAAFAAMVQAGTLALVDHERKYLGIFSHRTTHILPGAPLPENAPRLERAIFQAAANPATNLAPLVAAGLPVAKDIEASLQKRGLLASGPPPAHCLAAGLLMAAPLVVGSAKIIVGLSRGKPVGFLVGACLVTAIAALLFWLARSRSTPRGKAAQQTLEKEYRHLTLQAPAAEAALSPAQWAMVVGLFGAGLLAAGPLAKVHAMLPSTAGGGGCSSGGGGCGGGGCGGGGCGGGGCGGCGG